MKLLLVGGGGREHALAWKLKRDDPTLELLAAPGNPGIAGLGRCLPVASGDIGGLLEVARRERADLTVVGPEVPLATGIVDAFRTSGLAIFGPTKAAAEIESSKSFAKELMLDAGVPTALAERHTDSESAKRAVRSFGEPVVIKASGLAAGKGVVVCDAMEDADAAIDAMLRDGRFGPAGSEILVEEYMEGEELSILALTDGDAVLPMLPAQDHKRLLDGDQGPNTGGMGAYAPVSIADERLVSEAVRRIFRPTLQALSARGRRFSGLLYAGLMLTSSGPRVVEFNCRFGDPETQALLPLLESDLVDLLDAIARGDRIDGSTLAWSGRSAVATVVAAAGYPGAPQTGAEIVLPPEPDDVIVFHAGTARTPRGTLLTDGGRVLAVSGIADTIDRARAASVGYAEEIQFDGKHFRTDIGWRESRRGAGAPRG